jgi:hypothetical protein
MIREWIEIEDMLITWDVSRVLVHKHGETDNALKVGATHSTFIFSVVVRMLSCVCVYAYVRMLYCVCVYAVVCMCVCMMSCVCVYTCIHPL